MSGKSDGELAAILWLFHLCSTNNFDADALFVLGSNDLDVALYASELFHEYHYPLVVCSGGVAHCDDLLATGWEESEAATFSTLMVENGVPKASILLEQNSKNTGENFLFSKKVFEENSLSLNNALIVQKPFMEKRALLTAKKVWPDVEWRVTSRQGSWWHYVKGKPHNDILNVLVGDTMRVEKYGKLGFQIECNMPSEVRSALDELISRGYTRHLP